LSDLQWFSSGYFLVLAAAMLPAGLIGDRYDRKEERPKAVGIWAAATFIALPIGPILGGRLLMNYWWGRVFLINVPVASIGLACKPRECRAGGLVAVPGDRMSGPTRRALLQPVIRPVPPLSPELAGTMKTRPVVPLSTLSCRDTSTQVRLFGYSFVMLA